MSNAQIPSYSGVTINISNPTVNANPYSNQCPSLTVPQTAQSNPVVVTNPTQQALHPGQNNLPQSYPADYYLNNYNYQQNITTKEPAAAVEVPQNEQQDIKDSQSSAAIVQDEKKAQNNIIPQDAQESQKPQEPVISAESSESSNSSEDMSASNKIISSLDEKVAKEKELQEKGKQTRVVALTDEYIMSLENYLNNQNTDIRLMAAKEILTRLDEDKTRYDDAALNALLNKMLQDPQKLIRIAALSAFSSGLASGNDYTIQLLNNIQQNPNSDKEDVVEAANILLKMSADTEIKYVDPNLESTMQRQRNLEQQLSQQQKLLEQMQQKNKAE